MGNSFSKKLTLSKCPKPTELSALPRLTAKLLVPAALVSPSPNPDPLLPPPSSAGHQEPPRTVPLPHQLEPPSLDGLPVLFTPPPLAPNPLDPQPSLSPLLPPPPPSTPCTEHRLKNNFND